MKSQTLPLLAALCGLSLLPFAATAAESAPVANAASSVSAPAFAAALRAAPFRVLLADGKPAPESAVKLERIWSGELCRPVLKNVSSAPISIREVIVFDFSHGLPGDTRIHGEGFQKLQQHLGTLAKPVDLGMYLDRGHYKMKEPEGLRTAYGMLMLSPKGSDRTMLGFTSCKRFAGRFSFNGTRLRISLDTENLTLAPGESWALEEFFVTASPSREALYERLATAIGKNHPRLKHDPVPTGWCSWNCFGPGVTAKNVSDVSTWIQKNLPTLRYIQIDDGYQPWMGDWFEHGKAFDGGVDKVLKDIRAQGLEPAIWVAPFIASAQSKLFKEHPDWMVKDANGKPLCSKAVTYDGWRQMPWYALDGTHPEVQKHLENLFRKMRREWGCTYFKLDANFWGAMPGGHHYDPKATRIEAYRRGMEAVLRGTGDAFVLGCNHPMWASLGLIHGGRSSNDVHLNWASFRDVARENLHRNWQNGRIWWNDPDTINLTDSSSKDIMDPAGKPITTGRIPENEYLFHATSLFASGGMMLSGDDLTKITPRRLAILKKLLPPTGISARFDDDALTVGVTELPGRRMYSVLNWDDKPAERSITLPAGKWTLTDYWTDADLGTHSGTFVLPPMGGRSGRVIEAKPAK